MMRAKVLPSKEYWSLREPYDLYLPETISADEVEDELGLIQRRFRSWAETVGTEGVDWEFPGHYQHVRVFYVYLYKPELYTPELARAIRDGFESFEGKWIGEFECDKAPDNTDGCLMVMVYLDGEIIFDSVDAYSGIVKAMALELEN